MYSFQCYFQVYNLIWDVASSEGKDESMKKEQTGSHMALTATSEKWLSFVDGVLRMNTEQESPKIKRVHTSTGC